MKIHSLLFGLFFIMLLSSCSKNEEPVILVPSVTNYPKSGVLGELIKIDGKNFQPEKIQVFFDEEKAQLHSFSEDGILFFVPITLKRYNPTLKVINLKTNENILEETFLLKKPVIKGFNTSKISFDENLIINGENFDDNSNFIEVYVNNEKAKIIRADYTKLEIQIPYKINTSSLDIQVKAQLQETAINKQVSLRKPVIETVKNSTIRLRNTLEISGKYFNPRKEYGEIYINDIKSHFTIFNSNIRITVPQGPYKEFKISKITYKTADLETNFTTNVKILDNGILVDYFDQGHFGNFVTYNNKAYAFSSQKVHSSDNNPTVELFEFTETEEKWKKINGIKFRGYIKEMIYDNNHSIYLFITTKLNFSELFKIDLTDFSVEKIATPFDASLRDARMFHFKDHLYVLYGATYINNQTVKTTKNYKYAPAEKKWTVLDSTLFTDSLWKNTFFESKYHKNILYTRIGNSIYRLEDNLTLTHIKGGMFLFSYQNTLLCRTATSGAVFYVFDALNPAKDVSIQWNSGGFFFALNNNIYFHDKAANYNGNVLQGTFRLKKELLHEIL